MGVFSLIPCCTLAVSSVWSALFRFLRAEAAEVQIGKETVAGSYIAYNWPPSVQGFQVRIFRGDMTDAKRHNFSSVTWNAEEPCSWAFSGRECTASSSQTASLSLVPSADHQQDAVILFADKIDQLQGCLSGPFDCKIYCFLTGTVLPCLDLTYFLKNPLLKLECSLQPPHLWEGGWKGSFFSGLGGFGYLWQSTSQPSFGVEVAFVRDGPNVLQLPLE